MQSVLYVDSRMRTGGSSDSSFSIDLRESLHLSDHGVRVDKFQLCNSFFTTDLGEYAYYKNGSGGLQYYEIAEQAYTGTQLAAALQTATSRATTYDPNANSITQDAIAGQEPLSDEELKAYSSGFPTGASATNPMSLNTVLGSYKFYVTAAPATYTIKWQFVKMSPYDYLFLRSRRLTVQNSHDPNGRHDVLAKIVLSKGIGAMEESDTPDGVYLKLPNDMTIRTIDFEITDVKGAIVNLRGRPVSFELCFD